LGISKVFRRLEWIVQNPFDRGRAENFSAFDSCGSLIPMVLLRNI